MAVEPLPIEDLLFPIPGDSPTGPELNRNDADGLLYRLKFARDEAWAAEDRRFRAREAGDPEDALPRPNWAAVAALATELLQSLSKDFRAACWLTEAQIRLSGFAGLSYGVQVCQGLCDLYWNDINPKANAEEGHFGVVGLFSAVCGESTRRWLRLWPIITGANNNSYCVDDHIRATRQGESTQSAAAPDGPTLDAIINAASEFGRDSMMELFRNVESSKSSLDSLAEFFSSNCRPDEHGEASIPYTKGLRDDLGDVLVILQSLRGALSDPLEDEVNTPSPDDELHSDPSTAIGKVGGPIGSREEAMRMLLRIADYFERAEPHSPVSYSVRQAVRWGRMSLPDLVAELIADEGSRDDFKRRVGLEIRKDSP